MPEEQADLIKPQEKETVWYALQTLYCKEKPLADFFMQKGYTCFIPMRYEEQITPDGKKHIRQIPAVHNLLFLAKTVSSKQLIKDINDCPFPAFLIRHRDTKLPYEIRNKEMVEFRAVCDPNYQGTLYVDASLAEAKSGQRVRVIHGNFKGLEGKLVRHKNRYYVVITLVTLGVMVHIPKWYCEKIG